MDVVYARRPGSGRVIDDTWDAIVVGAGLGGLSAAASLAQGGLRVAVLEQHVVAGGYAHRFLRKARASGRVYDFDVALHMTGDLGPDRWLGRRLGELGVSRRFRVRTFDDAYRTRGPAHDLLVPANVDAYEALLCRTFPAEVRGIRELFALFRDADLGASGFAEVGAGARALMGRTVAEVVAAHVRDERFLVVFATLWPYLGTPPDRLCAMTFGQMWTSYHVGGCCYIEGGGQALADAFVDVILEAGGIVRLGCAVERIVTHAGRVVGVETTRHGSVRAPVVVSNANGPATFEHLLDEPALATKDRWKMNEMPVSASAHETYLGIEGDATNLGLRDRLLFEARSYDIASEWSSVSRGDLPSQGFAIANHNLSEPGRAPRGCSILNVIALANGSLWNDLEDTEYRRRKLEVEQRLVGAVARYIPDVRERIEVCETGTPHTMTRYSRNKDGAIYGIAATPDSHSYKRPQPRTQVPGLYLAGAWTFPAGGFVGAMVSGLNTADLVRADVA